MDGDTYIDPASEKTVLGGATALDVLNDYKEISSAQMFGLSDVERLVFLCGQDKMVSKSDTWFEDRMGRKVAKAFPTPKAKPTPVPVSYRKVFEAVCSR